MNKPYQKRQQGHYVSGLGQRTVHNNLYEAPFDPNKKTKFYGVITVKDKNFVTEYEGKFRSEAKVLFEEDARMMGGNLTTIGAYK